MQSVHVDATSGREPSRGAYLAAAGANPPVLVGLLGSFCLLKCESSVPLREGGKAKSLLSELALSPRFGMHREALLTAVWPESEPALASQSLHSLVYSLHRQLGDAIGGKPPVMHQDGIYRLNAEAGVVVDIALFDALLKEGERHARSGSPTAAAETYARAIDLYRGDLSIGHSIRAIVERERLRASFLTLLAWLADYHYAQADLAACLGRALQLLANEPCREDAHRLVMRCYVRRGERAQALRQYRLCERVLRTEFDTAPETATVSLFDQIRLDPGRI
jgi:DNA-binding SARP family transcriptional activator